MTRSVVSMTIDDALHYSSEERKMIVDGYAPHERDARSKGIPTMGSGAVFPVSEDEITCEPFEIPIYWPRIAGIDFGWTHATSVTWLAHDTDADIIYITDCYKVKETLIPVICSAIKARGNYIPVSFPHDGLQVRDAMHGQQLAKQYRNEGVNMLKKHAQFKRDKRAENQGSVTSVEAGLQEMLTRMNTGRWKVFSNCNAWLEEFRMYHRKDGVIHKEYDDALDSSRYAMMMLRYAKTLQMHKPKQLQSTWKPADPGMGY